jgi:hypothetical protein
MPIGCLVIRPCLVHKTMLERDVRRRLGFRRQISPGPMTDQEQQAAERALARLIASAHAADHPELFETGAADGSRPKIPGPPSAAAEVSDTPAEREGGPDTTWSLEYDKDDIEPRD